MNSIYTPAEQANTGGWIPVEDRLPEYAIEVFLFNGVRKIGFYANNLQGKPGFFTSFNDLPFYSVTHWQPLPPAPEAG